MKDGLVPGHGLRKLRYLCVLILVVVEDGLVLFDAPAKEGKAWES